MSTRRKKKLNADGKKSEDKTFLYRGKSVECIFGSGNIQSFNHYPCQCSQQNSTWEQQCMWTLVNLRRVVGRRTYLGTWMANASSAPERSGSSKPSLLDFEIVEPQGVGKPARCGLLSFRDRRSIQTPHYIASSSRGTVPHVSQDNLREHTCVSSLYAGLEDCEDPFVLRWLSELTRS